MAEERNFFEEFINTDITKWVEKKNNLEYLEWSAAWTLLKKKYPLATFSVERDLNNRPWFIDPDSKSGWVELTVKIPELGMQQTDTYAVMNLRMQAESADNINSVVANKAQRRCLTKMVAEMTGIGLGLYSKSDSTSDDKEIEYARERLTEIYKKRIKFGDKAKAEADKIVKDTNERVELAADDQERLDIYAEAKKKMLDVRK